jgi:hypothetical protein
MVGRALHRSAPGTKHTHTHTVGTHTHTHAHTRTNLREKIPLAPGHGVTA